MAMALDIANLTLGQNEDRVGKFIIAIRTALVARGWTVEGSGDGLAAVQNRTQTAGPFNVFTSGLGYYTGAGTWNGALGANTISNARAWIILKEPAPSTRAFCFQRTSGTSSNGSETQLIVGISYGGFATSGATSVAPPAAVGTSQMLLSTYNSAGGTFLDSTVNSYIAGPNVYVVNMMVNTSAAGANTWPFYGFGYCSTLATRTFGMIYESLVDYVSTDLNPVVSFVGSFTGTFGTPNIVHATNFIGLRDDGTALTSFKVMSFTGVSNGGFPTNTPLVNADGKMRSMPFFVFNDLSGQGHWKGRMEHFTMNMQARNYPSTLDVATVNAKIYLGVMLGDWAQNIVPGT